MNSRLTDAPALVARVTRGIGATGRDDALPAIRATISGLCEFLDETTGDLLRSNLPAAFGVVHRGAKENVDVTLDALFARIAYYEGTATGFAREHAEVVCAALGETLNEELLARIGRVLPEAFAALFHPKTDEAPPLGEVGGARPGHTLATGRTGSRHPLSESRPKEGHTHSVGEPNPHGESKLSSAVGLTQERRDHALANAEEDERKRKISEASG